MILTRKETPKDYTEVHALIKEAFSRATYSDGKEHTIVASLRNSESFIPELSLVAEIDGSIVGHIMFSLATVGRERVVVLAPLSVKPEFQRRGVGKALVNEGHKNAKTLPYPYIFVLGSKAYYSQFGYTPANHFGVKAPEGIPQENFMAIKIQEQAEPLRGTLVYAKEFGI